MATLHWVLRPSTALAALAAVACADRTIVDSEPAPAGKPTAKDIIQALNDFEVKAEVRDANTTLEIAWTLENKSDKPVLALTLPLEHNQQPSSEKIYVVKHGKDQVEFALRAFPVPQGMNVAVLDRIGAVPLAPGGRLEGRVSVAHGLSENIPYREPIALPYPRRARVCIGLLKPDAQFPGPRLPDGTLATYHEEMVASLQLVVCSSDVPVPKRPD